MDRIYILVGKILEQFQQLEDDLALLIYIESCNDLALTKFEGDIQAEARKRWIQIESKSLGIKLSKIEKLHFFESENDIVVLEYLKNKRNYIAHNFFIDNKFDTENHFQDAVEKLENIYITNVIVCQGINKMTIAHVRSFNFKS